MKNKLRKAIFDYSCVDRDAEIGGHEICRLCCEIFILNNKKQIIVKNGVRQLGPLCGVCYTYFVSTDGIHDSIEFLKALHTRKST